ncbi:dihydropteroate synthase [Acetobacter oeni]|uniref:Dihydropteroate synthase n=1 Tax=Acetobacter oeni TaxID=304077 RepID=A0A511XLA0_9PROT|nr:dihydropteroate synthase [Acetobacter oeni]MBB3883910.1 dihydropteroate synthase [Acetobacter oeni]NHO19917.1 dihydropteroate synthase [Acetobacter oeni]GEN63708.1 dihydropteroate synthase [Acetobacter oeni]
MDARRLIEPAGLMWGSEARAAIGSGIALPLAGGSTAFTVVTLIEGNVRTGPLPVERIPGAWNDELAVLTGSAPMTDLPPGALVMGILNVTPDSFSDGGQYKTARQAISRADDMIAGGVSVIDIGAESTRPFADIVTSEEEWGRLSPVLKEIVGTGVAISVDTRNARTMEAALNAGASLINDVSALTYDPDALPLLAERSCPVILMHMRGTPETMNSFTSYEDVAVDVVRELAARIEKAERAGVSRSRIIVDPGIGFAKNTEQNCELLRRLPIFANLDCRLVLGTSRKRFIGSLTGVTQASQRDPGTLAASAPGMNLPGTLFRVHDYVAMKQAVQVWEGCFAS